MQAVVFVELVFEREPADRAAKAEKIDYLCIDLAVEREMMLLYQFHEEARRLVFRNSNVNAVLRARERNVKEPALLGKRHAPVLIHHELHYRIVLDLTREAELALEHVYKYHVVIAQALRAVRRHESDVGIRILFASDLSAKLAEQARPDQLIHIIVISTDQKYRFLRSVLLYYFADHRLYLLRECFERPDSIIKHSQPDRVGNMFRADQLLSYLR